MLRPALICIFCLACAACVQSQAYRNMLTSGGALSVEPASGQGYDYTVAIKSANDIGFDPNDKNQRDAMALNAISNQCPSAKIVKEDVIDMGNGVLGRRNNYFMRIKC